MISNSHCNKNYRNSYWSPSTVQNEVGEVLNQPAFNKNIHASYLIIYKHMTKARDIARFTQGDPMHPSQILDVRLNDALTDLMTRNYLEIVKSCVIDKSKPFSQSLDLGGLFHILHYNAEKQNLDSIRVALGSTALYLTSHLAICLSVLPHIDDIWEGTQYQTISSRVKRMEDYKPAYDAFNSFLAKNMQIFPKALAEADLLKNPIFENTTFVIKNIAPWELFFGYFRDISFKYGQQIALDTPLGKHPLTIKDSKGQMRMKSDVVLAEKFPDEKALSKTLNSLERFSNKTLTLFVNPLFNVFNGKRFNEKDFFTRQINISQRKNSIRVKKQGNSLSILI